VVIEHPGSKVRASWKQPFTDKNFSCSGVWFEGTISPG